MKQRLFSSSNLTPSEPEHEFKLVCRHQFLPKIFGFAQVNSFNSFRGQACDLAIWLPINQQVAKGYADYLSSRIARSQA